MKCVYCLMKQRRYASIQNALTVTLAQREGTMAASVLLPCCEAHHEISVFVDLVHGEEVPSSCELLEDAAPLFRSHLLDESHSDSDIIEDLRRELAQMTAELDARGAAMRLKNRGREDMSEFDWTLFDRFPESECECRCGEVFLSHAKGAYVVDAPRLVSRRPCPKCGEHDLCRASSDFESFSIGGRGQR